MSSKVKRTYASRSDKPEPCFSSPVSMLSSPPSAPSIKRKRLFGDSQSQVAASAKRVKSSKEKPRQKTLKQLHFCIDQSIVRTCAICKLSYTKGAEDDEALHRAHCARVQRGMEWGKEEERDKAGAGNVKEIVEVVKLKDGKKGRIICVDATGGGKIGTKLSTLLETINVTLSASTLSPEALRASKAYLFLLPAITPNKEKIVGCIFAQRIEKAMAVAPSSSSISGNHDATPSSRSLLTVDDTSGLFCYPELLPTALGISRIFVTSTQRRQGIASSLLSAAAQTAVHGCVLDPKDGQIAFSQTTGDGIALMRNWGQGGIRIYDEDNC
ncbi:hypothetical protein F5876DRAFT_88568 [Lentinula aff. lateritia]|uniref:Uncharacterized protein n=1 Tax=Lentinula aff. lateritia TaxID=2804960 RepID=A0ACC1U1W3_9AGAR|nr:hypothetical protein F5876DRAFT_88568 [Lentinula aff. lateritia]